MLSAVGVQTPILVDLILSGDQDALAGYYDGRAPSVHQYCAQVCPDEQVEEAVLASFTEFLGRVRAAGPDADLDDLPRKTTRTAAASRMEVSNVRDPACRSMPELIAARANGALPRDEGPISAHLEHCRSCRRTVQRLVEAEDALVRAASREASGDVRSAWLLMASREAGAREGAAKPEAPATEERAAKEQTRPPATAAPETPETVVPEPPPGHGLPAPAPAPEPPPADAQAPTPPPTPQPVPVRRRTGGLIGAARRAAARKH